MKRCARDVDLGTLKGKIVWSANALNLAGFQLLTSPLVLHVCMRHALDPSCFLPCDALPKRRWALFSGGGGGGQEGPVRRGGRGPRHGGGGGGGSGGRRALRLGALVREPERSARKAHVADAAGKTPAAEGGQGKGPVHAACAVLPFLLLCVSRLSPSGCVTANQRTLRCLGDIWDFQQNANVTLGCVGSQRNFSKIACACSAA